MDCTNAPLRPFRRLKTGATILAAGICLLLASAPRMALACGDPFHHSYAPDSPTVDAIAGSIAFVPAYGALGVCGALMLPADVYWKAKRPQDNFGAHVSTPVCMSAVDSVYLVSGFPFFVVKKLLWDLPHPLP